MKRVEDEKNFKVRQEAFHTKEKSVELSLLKNNNEQEKFYLQRARLLTLKLPGGGQMALPLGIIAMVHI